MPHPDYISPFHEVPNSIRPDSKIDIYYDPMTLAIVNYMNAGFDVADVVSSLRVTQQVKDKYDIQRSLLDFSAAKLPTGVSRVLREVRQLDRAGLFLPMYIIGMHQNLEVLLTALGGLVKLKAYPVRSYQEFVAKVGASSKQPKQE